MILAHGMSLVSNGYGNSYIYGAIAVIIIAIIYLWVNGKWSK
jgi:hypothetical protein